MPFTRSFGDTISRAKPLNLLSLVSCVPKTWVNCAFCPVAVIIWLAAMLARKKRPPIFTFNHPFFNVQEYRKKIAEQSNSCVCNSNGGYQMFSRLCFTMNCVKNQDQAHHSHASATTTSRSRIFFWSHLSPSVLLHIIIKFLLPAAQMLLQMPIRFPCPAPGNSRPTWPLNIEFAFWRNYV